MFYSFLSCSILYSIMRYNILMNYGIQEVRTSEIFLLCHPLLKFANMNSGIEVIC